MPTRNISQTASATALSSPITLSQRISPPRSTLKEEKCELLGITTVTGEPVTRAKLASALCIAAGREDIPVIPGVEKPIFGRVRQTPYTQKNVLERLDHQSDFPNISAVEFMRRTIRENPGEVTLLAVGPLTNVALLFALDREIPSMLKSLVMMCGDFKNPTAEWNAKLDRFATATVYSSDLASAVSYGFDVTSTFSIGHDEMVERFNGGIADTAREFATEYLSKPTRRLFFHDPLAAVGLFHPEVCTYKRGDVAVRVDMDEDSGYTDFTENENGVHLVADTVDIEKFYEIYFDTVTKSF